MTRILVLYYSSYGHVRALAQAEAEGARSVPGTHVDIRRVPETVSQEIRQKAGFASDDTPIADPADLEAYDAIIFGTPTRFGMMAGQMKTFLDQAGGLWARNALVGKLAAVFASTGSQHGGHEATLLSTQIPAPAFRNADRGYALQLRWPDDGRPHSRRRTLWRGHHRWSRRFP